MARKKAGDLAAEALASIPSADQFQAALDALKQAILDAVQRVNDGLPPELRQDPTVVAQRVNAEFDKISFTAWRQQIVTEVTALIVAGSGPVRHDPTELA